MAQTRTITLSETTWQQLDSLLKQAPSEFIRFCLLDEIVKEGIAGYKETHGLDKDIEFQRPQYEPLSST